MRGSLSSGEGLAFAVRDGGEADPGVMDKRLYLVQSEFGSMLKIMGRDGNSLPASFVMRGWRGTLRLLQRHHLYGYSPCIVIVGHVTREELVKHLGDTEKANGFANRFVWVLFVDHRFSLCKQPDQADLHP
jgi:hypothetical protein